MKQTVHNTSLRNQNLLATADFGNHSEQSGCNLKRKAFLTFLGAFAAIAAMAQTYTTKADGAWNSTNTWVGGVVPSVGAGKIVNIKHDVTYNLTSDFSIAGTLNIEGDTLRFPASYDKKVMVAATGIINVKNGGFLQSVSAKKSEMEISGGRIIMENGRMVIGKILKSLAGTKKTLKNSYLLVGEKYELEGTSSKRSIDTLRLSTIESASGNGVFDIKDYCSFYVDNAKLIVGKDKLAIKPSSEIRVLPGAAGNYGIKQLKIAGDLENDGAWDARIDAFCIGGDVKGSKSADVDFTRPEDCSNQDGTPAPELSFMNPVLEKGTANKEGAEYRFKNITAGVDAVIKLKKFSRNDIVMRTVDNSALGWSKAFQPEFGLPGLVQPNQNWYIDFEMTFYEAGTKKRKKVQKADFTALDVDGDGYSIAEYALFSNPANVSFSTASSLVTSQAGGLGSLLPCSICHVSSALIQCNQCQGTGSGSGSGSDDDDDDGRHHHANGRSADDDDDDDNNDADCSKCKGSGAVQSSCGHAFHGLVGNVLQGTVQNFNNIDTNATQVMATYQYSNVDRVNFRYGGRSGAYAVNGSGIRLNSLWSKSFALTPWTALSVNFANFTVIHEKGDANLSWKSAHGEELKKFVVQRSTDGKNYSDIATVLTGNASNYSYNDKSVSSNTGVVYYRVASIDHTEEVLYSNVKMLRLAKTEQQSLVLSTFPNPVVNDVRITLPNTWQGKPVILQLYSANGTIAKSIQLGAASQTETMSVSGLMKGLYVVKAICGEESAQQRIIKN